MAVAICSVLRFQRQGRLARSAKRGIPTACRPVTPKREIFATEGNGVPSQTPPEGELPTDEQIIDTIRKGRTAVQCLQAMNAVPGPSSKYTLDISNADASLHETARICIHMIVADLCDKSRWIRNAESQE